MKLIYIYVCVCVCIYPTSVLGYIRNPNTLNSRLTVPDYIYIRVRRVISFIH